MLKEVNHWVIIGKSLSGLVELIRALTKERMQAFLWTVKQSQWWPRAFCTSHRWAYKSRQIQSSGLKLLVLFLPIGLKINQRLTIWTTRIEKERLFCEYWGILTVFPVYRLFIGKLTTRTPVIFCLSLLILCEIENLINDLISALIVKKIQDFLHMSLSHAYI